MVGVMTRGRSQCAVQWITWSEEDPETENSREFEAAFIRKLKLSTCMASCANPSMAECQRMQRPHELDPKWKLMLAKAKNCWMPMRAPEPWHTLMTCANVRAEDMRTLAMSIQGTFHSNGTPISPPFRFDDRTSVKKNMWKQFMCK